MFKTASNAQIGNTGTAPGKDRANIEKAGNQLLRPIYTLSPISPTSSSHHVLLALSNVNTQLIYQILFWCGRQGCGLSHVNTQCWAETRVEDFSPLLCSLHSYFTMLHFTFFYVSYDIFPQRFDQSFFFQLNFTNLPNPNNNISKLKDIYFSNNLNGQNGGN